MKNNNRGEIEGVVLAMTFAIITFVLGCVTGSSFKNYNYRHDLINRGVVKYIADTKTGDSILIWVSDGAEVEENK